MQAKALIDDWHKSWTSMLKSKISLTDQSPLSLPNDVSQMFDTRCFLQSRGDFTLPPPSVANPSLPPTTKEENYTGLTINHAKSAPQRQLQEQGGERNQTEHLCLGAQGHRRRRRHQLVHTGQGAQRVQPCHKAVPSLPP